MAWDDHPQAVVEAWLYLLAPTVVMKARVNLASASYPVHEIPYDGVTVGAYTDIHIGQTILIGSTEGAYDLGRTYLRATPDSDTLPIGYSSRGTRAGEVTLTDNAYITVLDTYEVWWKPQRLDDSTGALYKDYDLDYTTPPSPIMHVGDLGGLGRIAFTDGSVLLVDDFDWGGSTLVNTGETWIDRNWYFEDGTITVGTTTSQAPGVEFTAGKRWIRLYGEGSDGGYTYRRYLVVALDPTTPATVRFNNLKIKRTAEGQTLTANLHERLDPATYLPGTVVMYLAKERRGATATIVQRFAGWLDVESSFSQASVTHTDKGTTITAVDVAGKLAQIKALPAVFENEAAQGSWLHMVGCNPERMMHRQLAFETSALSLCDWSLTGLSGSAAYPVMAYSTTGGTMYGVCDGLAKAFGRRLTCDSQGRLWLKVDPMRQDSGDRTATVQRAVTEAAWKSLKWQSRARSAVGALKAQNAVISSGYASALTGSGLSLFPDVYSIAPGEVAGQGVGESVGERGIVQSQTESNARLGHDYQRATADGSYTVDLAHGVDADIEPADMTWVTISATEGNAGYRGPTLATARGLPLTVEISLNAETGVSTQSLTWEKETVGQPGTREPRPNASSADIPVNVTPPPPGSTRTRSVTGLGLIAEIALFCTSNKVHLMAGMLDLLAGGTPAVESFSLSLTGTLGGFVVAADSPLYLDGTGAVNGVLATTTGARTISDIFGARTLGTAYSYVDGTVAGENQVQIQAERGNPDWVLVAVYHDTLGTRVYRSTDGGATWADESSLPSFNDTNLPTNAATWKPGLWMLVDGSGWALVSACTADANPPGADFWETLDYGATWTKITASGYSAGDWPVACITKPIQRNDVVFHGLVDFSSPNTIPYLYRIIGSTQAEISASVSGSKYGAGYPSTTGGQRVISVSDDDPAAVAYVGYNVSNSKFGVFQTFNGLDSTPTWNVVVTPDTTVPYRGVYYVSATLMFLFGESGAFAIARFEGGAWAVYEATISGAGDIVGMCGG